MFNLVEVCIQITKKKIENVKLITSRAVEANVSFTAKQLASIVGLINSLQYTALGVIVYIQTKMCQHVISSTQTWASFIFLPAEARTELKFWNENISHVD